MTPSIHPVPTRACTAAALVIATSLSACAIVGSHSPTPGQRPSGLLYHLPKAVLPVELVDTGGALEFRVKSPSQIADPQQRYLLRHPVNFFASDNVKVEYDTSGLLLSKLTIDSTDESLNVLKEVARASAIGRAEAAGAQGEILLASGDFDPDAPDDDPASNGPMMAALQAALGRHVARWAQQCARTDISDEKDKPAPENCAMAKELGPTLQQNQRVLRIKATPMGSAKAAVDGGAAAGVSAGTVEADCTVGLCYRGQQAFRLTLEVGALFSRTMIRMLPNGSPAIALALDRAPFVKTEHTVEFQAGGALKGVETKRPGSALQLVSWPLDVYKAVLAATSELITLRIGAKDNEVRLAQKELDTAKELKRLADEMAAFNKGTKESGGASAGQRGLLSIRIGQGRAGSNADELPTEQPKNDCKPGQPCTGAAAAGAAK